MTDAITAILAILNMALKGAALAAILAIAANPASLPPCTHEDGSGGPVPCYWDASTRGNGLGHDVIMHDVDGPTNASTGDGCLRQ